MPLRARPRPPAALQRSALDPARGSARTAAWVVAGAAAALVLGACGSGQGQGLPTPTPLAQVQASTRTQEVEGLALTVPDTWELSPTAPEDP